jgi:hypothetical protein
MHDPRTYAPGAPVTETGDKAIAALKALLQDRTKPRAAPRRASRHADIQSARHNFWSNK